MKLKTANGTERDRTEPNGTKRNQTERDGKTGTEPNGTESESERRRKNWGRKTATQKTLPPVMIIGAPVMETPAPTDATPTSPTEGVTPVRRYGMTQEARKFISRRA